MSANARVKRRARAHWLRPLHGPRSLERPSSHVGLDFQCQELLAKRNTSHAVDFACLLGQPGVAPHPFPFAVKPLLAMWLVHTLGEAPARFSLRKRDGSTPIEKMLAGDSLVWYVAIERVGITMHTRAHRDNRRCKLREWTGADPPSHPTRPEY